MLSIKLHNLVFQSYHGVHEEERILGNSFVVNVAVCFNVKEKVTSIADTVNYVPLYNIIKKRMDVPVALLETLAGDMVTDIHEFDSRLKSITISIEKKNPPILNIQGSVSVSITKDF